MDLLKQARLRGVPCAKWHGSDTTLENEADGFALQCLLRQRMHGIACARGHASMAQMTSQCM